MLGLRAIAVSGLLVAMTSVASAGVWFPPQEAGERVVPRDKTTGIMIVFNCFKAGGLGQGSYFADHGTVTFKEGTRNVCSKTDYPVGFAYYTPNPGFVGDDTIQVYYGPSPFRLVIHVRDGVPQTPSSAQPQKKVHRHASTGGGDRHN